MQERSFALVEPHEHGLLEVGDGQQIYGESVAIRMAGPRCSFTENQAAQRDSIVAQLWRRRREVARSDLDSLTCGRPCFEPLRLCNPGSPICMPSDPSLSDSSPIRLRLRADRHPRIARRQPRTKGLRRFEGRERVESEPSAPPCFLGSALRDDCTWLLAKCSERCCQIVIGSDQSVFSPVQLEHLLGKRLAPSLAGGDKRDSNRAQGIDGVL